MNTTSETLQNGSDGNYEFTINYSERELACRVEKKDDILQVHIDNNINATLQIEPDGTLHQTAGNTLPDSNIEFIKKQVLGHGV